MSTLTANLVVSLLLVGLVPLAQAAQFEYRIKRSSWNSAPPPATPPAGSTDGTVSPPSGSGGSDASAPPSAVPAPRAELSTTSLDFGHQATHTMAKSQILMTNTGNAPLQITAPPALAGSNAFGLGLTNCTGSLAPGQSCAVEVVYAPEAAVVDAGWVTFSTNAPDSPASTSLKGTGYNPVTLAAASIRGALMNNNYSYDFKQHLNVANESSPDKVMASWRIVSGSLPPGLTLSNIGVVSGKATSQTTTTFRLRVEYRSNVAEQTYTLKSGTACYIGECSSEPTPTPAPTMPNDEGEPTPVPPPEEF